MKSLLMLLSLSLLAGCAAPGLTPSWLIGQQGVNACADTLSQDQQLALNLAQDMAREGRSHAALAHLQGLPEQLPEVRLGKARILRNLNQPGAEDFYQSLRNTCLAAAGNQGLGQLAMTRGDYATALEYLNTAVRLEPTDARMRNDLGLVQLHLGQPEPARFELLTALELDQDYLQPALNLLTLLFYQNQWQPAAELTSRLGLSADQVRRAQQQAQALRSELAELSPETVTEHPAVADTLPLAASRGPLPTPGATP